MARYFIGIDVSTTASKVIAVDDLGGVVAAHAHPHELSTPRPLWAEQDPREWWHATQTALHAVLQIISARDVMGIGLTGQMHGLVALDENGEPVRPAILWNDGRSYAECEEITRLVGADRLYELIGTRLFPGFTAPKLVWIRKHEPELYQQIRHILLPKDYIRFRLSGALVTDVADGSGISLMDNYRRDWSNEMLRATEIPSEWLPELVESQTVASVVSETAAALTGLRAGTPIVGGAGDQPAGGIGNGIVRPNQVSLTVGTSGVAYASSAHYSPELNGRLHTFCGPVPSTWFHMGVMLSAAGGMRWFSDEIAQGMSVEAINQAVANVPTGSRGLLFAPYLSGERNPHPDPLARGAFVGLTIRHGLPEMARAVMEGVSFGMRDLLDLLRDLGLNPTEAVVSGGAAKSAIWRQMLTDIMGIPLYTVNTTEGGAFGAAILAAVGVGAFPDASSAVEAMIRRVDQTDPIPHQVQAYEEVYALHKTLYPTLQDTFSKLAQLEQKS